MRILKYLLLLLLLFSIGLFVFVATQKGDYNITKSALIKSPRAKVFGFVSDFRNWETFVSWNEENGKSQFTYPEKTTGVGSNFSWEGDDSDGSVKTLFLKNNDSLSQQMIRNGAESLYSWKFKDTIGGTKVTWNSKGKMDFKFKFLAFFEGGMTRLIGNTFEKSLHNLDQTLHYELNTYTVKINGIVKRIGTYYIKKTILCRVKSVPKNIQILIPKLQKYFDKNKLENHGNAFVLYNKYDTTNDLVSMTVCIPVKDSLNIMPGGEVESGYMETHPALKTTLTGDLTHIHKAWTKAFNYVTARKLVLLQPETVIEVYQKGVKDVRNPSKWVTEIYLPLYIKPVEPIIVPDSTVVKKPVYRKPIKKEIKKPETSTETETPVPVEVPIPSE